MRSLAVAVILFLVSTSGSGQQKFNYLLIDGRTVKTTHDLPLKIKIAKRFAFLGQTDHKPVFSGKPFNVSLAAFAQGDKFLMIHAEEHADGSGGLDYSNLHPDRLDAIAFNSKDQCAELDPSDVAEEHDLQFLMSGGFDPSPAVYIKQYFATSPRGTAEVVITFGKRVASCKEDLVNAEFKAQLDREFRSDIRISAAR